MKLFKTTIYILLILNFTFASINSQILKAAKKGDIKKIKICLVKGADINYADKAGYTALHHAARRGHIKTVKWLVNNGANISSQDIYGWTALDRAAEKGEKEIVEFLLEVGTKVQGGLFFWHSLKNHPQIVQMLMAAANN